MTTQGDPAPTAPQAPDDARAALAAFIRGCIEPSALALGTALTLTLSVYLGLLFGLSPKRFADRAGWFAQDRRDDHVFVSARAIQQGATSAPLSIVLIGASGLMESVDSQRLQKLLACEDEPLSVLTLATRGQTVSESAELLDALDGFRKGILVLGLGPKRLAVTNAEVESSRLALLMPGVREGAPFFDTPTARSNNYFWDNRTFFMSRLPYLAARLATGKKATFVSTSFIGRTGTLQEHEVERERLEGFDLWWSHHPRGFEILTRMQQGLKARSDVRAVYLTAPHNDGFFKDPKRAKVFDDYSARMSSFAQAYGVPFWDLDHQAELRTSDFYDYSHLRSQGARERYTAVLAERLRPLLTCGPRP